MQTFRDAAGREWNVTVDMPTLRRVSEAMAVDLVEAVRSRPEIVNDPVRLAELLFTVVRPQAEAAGVDQASFDQALTGDVLNAASDALTLAVADWLPPAVGNLLRKALAAARASQADLNKLVAEKLDGMSPAELLAMC